MAENIKRENSSIGADNQANNLRRWGIYAAVLLLVFLLGLIPMWLQKREVSRELETTQKQLVKSEIKGLLTASIVEARRGEYEPARLAASDFFTRVRSEIDTGEDSAYTETERRELLGVFTDRDNTITMLAQRDPAASERMTDIYMIFRQATGQTSPAPTPAQTPAQ
jgi:hypothetical protein